ncbi:hypothetical protein [Achromobacter marplatensis]|uniref:hypothetical protein n=1 Tax=Achromobacter marplatensis TaxID=470868 RepID=UPI003C76C691
MLDEQNEDVLYYLTVTENENLRAARPCRPARGRRASARASCAGLYRISRVRAHGGGPRVHLLGSRRDPARSRGQRRRRPAASATASPPTSGAATSFSRNWRRDGRRRGALERVLHPLDAGGSVPFVTRQLA